VFTEILNVVDLLGKPTVVIVTVGPAYCCYCSRPGGTAVTAYTLLSYKNRSTNRHSTQFAVPLRIGDRIYNYSSKAFTTGQTAAPTGPRGFSAHGALGAG